MNTAPTPVTAPVTTLRVERSSFHVNDCAACGARALAWLDVSPDGVETWRCLSCNTPMAGPNDGAPPLQRVGARAVRALGYAFVDEERHASSSKQSSCGAGGIRSCGSGGCSSGGSCGSGGGCGSGGCG